jgi:general secretion pathway protein I
MMMTSRGFTLIEVLVALALVAVALVAGLKAAGALTGNAERLDAVLAAQWCAENQLADLRLMRQFPGTGETEFRCQQLGHDYLGKQLVRATPNPNFRRVDAIISDADGTQRLTLSTILARY